MLIIFDFNLLVVELVQVIILRKLVFSIPKVLERPPDPVLLFFDLAHQQLVLTPGFILDGLLDLVAQFGHVTRFLDLLAFAAQCLIPLPLLCLPHRVLHGRVVASEGLQLLI